MSVLAGVDDIQVRFWTVDTRCCHIVLKMWPLKKLYFRSIRLKLRVCGAAKFGGKFNGRISPHSS